MAQRYPHDYDGILAGAPAIHWDKFQAYQIWPQLAMKFDAGGPIARSKQDAATAAAVASCDPLDGVTDGTRIGNCANAVVGRSRGVCNIWRARATSTTSE